MLLPVPPVGRGTDQAEGLSSYVVRLAVEHVVPTRILAFHVLGEATGIRSVRMMLMGRRGALLNGTGVWSRNLSSVLERLTLQPGLERLTMLPWGRLLSKTGLLSGVRRWCPDCYREMREQTGGCWDPLTWALSPVVWCPAHGRQLSEVCRTCGRTQPWLPRDTALGWCAFCGTDLVGPKAARKEESETASDQTVWSAGVCADLVAASSGGAVSAGPREFGRRIRRLVDEIDGGSLRAAGRRFGVSSSTPNKWILSGTTRFETLLRIGWSSGLHPLDFVLEEREFGTPRPRPIATPEKSPGQNNATAKVR